MLDMRWSRLLAEDVLDQEADFVCGPGCLAKETSEAAYGVIAGEKSQESDKS